MKRELSELREALLDLTGVLNRPQPDAALIGLAGVDLDRALFPVLARVERRGPLGIKELAELCGRDYTTVSRQITTLEGLGLVARQVNRNDARIKEAVVTTKGRAMTRALDRARAKILTSLLAEWDPHDLAELTRLLRKFADDALEFVREEKSRAVRAPARSRREPSTPRSPTDRES
jgi:DNA-binding MarR family transcriptional regulator